MLVTNKNKLREVSKEGSEVDPKILQDMKDTMKKHNGMGISAIQIGHPIRVFLAGSPAEVFINPRILERSTYTKTDWEGCLSCPGAHVRVKRSHSIILEYTNLEGKQIKRKFKGYDARVVQHEFDHLNGFLILDRGKVYQE